MLDANELRRRLIDAMDKASPKVTSVALADACDVTAQAVNGWRKTGRLAKRHIPKIAALTGKTLEYFLGDEPGSVSTNYGIELSLEEAIAVRRLKTALPEWQRYVIGLAMIDSHKTQEIILESIMRPVSDSRVHEAIPISPQARKRQGVKHHD